ncbi:MAG: hypothetical protein LW806_06150 [Planctomycetaceae bacterium]|nr:hypothetical protein [Planctomycetaceae bacterium]
MTERGASAARAGRVWTAGLAAGMIHLVAALVAILLGIVETSEWYDQRDYHLPVIRAFAEALPAPDLSDYNSATTPGYHLVMAVAMRVTGESMALWIVNACFGALFVAIVAAAVARMAGALAGIAGGLLLGCSPYVLSSSVWLTTDNLASIALVSAFLAAIPIASGSTRSPLRAGALVALAASAAVAVRQILAYAAAFPGAAIVARAAAERRMPRVAELALAALALVPALALVVFFVLLWGGLVPPTFREYHGGGANPATPVYALAVFAVWGLPVFVGMPGYLRELLSPRILLLALCAAGAACLVPSNYVVHVRFGGILWTVASKFPAPFERSLLLVPLAALGAAAIGAYLRLWSRSSSVAGRAMGVYALLAFAGMVIAQTANAQCFERYLQPPVVVFALVAAVAIAGRSLRTWPILAMALVAFGLSLVNVYRLAAG